jgi:chromosome segregation ATPase
MHELDRRVGLLRLLLADLTARREQTEEGKVQLRAQIARLVDFTVRRNGMVSNALAAMADIEERLVRADTDLRHIELLRQHTQEELDTLLVTRGIADARARLDELERRATALRSAPATEATSPEGVSAELAEIEAEMSELRLSIEVASDTAARALSGRHSAQG